MPKSVHTLAVLALLGGSMAGQSTTRPKFLDRARVQHSGPVVTVTANDSLPLFQAIFALRLEYGWQVSWESAPGYSHFDVVDDTGPKWRAAHPEAKGVTRPSGGAFTATFLDPVETSGADAERLVLSKLIDEYNATKNPGRYALREDSEGKLAVVGTAVRGETGALEDVRPLLDTQVTLDKMPRSVYDTIKSIFAALQSSTGSEVLLAAASTSLFRTTRAEIGGERVPARDLLKRALASTGQPIQYDLFFNPDVPVYILSLSPAMKEESDGLGGRRLTPAGR